MPRTRPRGYIRDYKPRGATRELLAAVDRVLDEFKDHLPLSERQIFYRLYALGVVDKTEQAYERVCIHVGNARRAGWIPFSSIRDDGVLTYAMDHYEDADHFRRSLRSKAQLYRRNLMANQRNYIEIWCEEAGIVSQVTAVSHQYSIRTFSNGGFNSITSKKDVADHICEEGKPAVILHLGDHDPSGVKVAKALREDVAAFVKADRPHGLVDVTFERVAVTPEQIERLALPTAPPKLKNNSHAKGWVGETCQIAALRPDDLARELRAAIHRHIDRGLMKDDREAQDEEREELTKLFLPSPS